MSKVYNENGSVTTGVWTISEGHEVTYKMTSITGLFARHESSSTVYTCSCGKAANTSLRALKADLAGHDAWKTAEERKAESDAFSAMLDDLLGQVAA